MKIKPQINALFLDAGFAHCGAVVIDIRKWSVVFARVLSTSPHQDESQALGNLRRSKELTYQLDKLVSDFDIRFVCGELPHGGSKSARAMKSMSMAVAILGAFCAAKNLDFYPVTPTEIKRLVRKTGAVDKKEVEKIVEREFGKVFLPRKKEYREHVSDAAASALVAKRKFSTKISEYGRL